MPLFGVKHLLDLVWELQAMGWSSLDWFWVNPLKDRLCPLNVQGDYLLRRFMTVH